MKDSVKIAEFIAFYDDENQVCEVIEAKSSSPNPENNEGNNKQRFNDFIDEICQKFINSFNLFLANRLERHSNDDYMEMPELFRNTNFSTLGFKFVLIIKNHRITWLQHISDELKQKMKSFIKTWNIHDRNIKVINDNIAHEQGYISFDNMLE